MSDTMKEDEAKAIAKHLGYPWEARRFAGNGAPFVAHPVSGVWIRRFNGDWNKMYRAEVAHTSVLADADTYLDALRKLDQTAAANAKYRREEADRAERIARGTSSACRETFARLEADHV